MNVNDDRLTDTEYEQSDGVEWITAAQLAALKAEIEKSNTIIREYHDALSGAEAQVAQLTAERDTLKNNISAKHFKAVCEQRDAALQDAERLMEFVLSVSKSYSARADWVILKEEAQAILAAHRQQVKS